MPGSTRLTFPFTTLPTTLLSRSRSMCSSANCLSSSNATRVSPSSALMMISFCIVPPTAAIVSAWATRSFRVDRRDRSGPPGSGESNRSDLRCREKVAGWPARSQQPPSGRSGEAGDGGCCCRASARRVDSSRDRSCGTGRADVDFLLLLCPPSRSRDSEGPGASGVDGVDRIDDSHSGFVEFSVAGGCPGS